MQITAIKKQASARERVNVFVDGAYAFSLDYDQLLDLKLRIGLDIDKVQFSEYSRLSSKGLLRQRVIRWVMLRPRSLKELKDYLGRHTKVLNAKETDEIVDECQRKKWVDDASFARWWVERQSRQKSSSVVLRRELLVKGVSREIVQEVLASAEHHDEAALRELIARHRHKTRYRDEAKFTRYLVSKGFHYSLVKRALADDAEGAAV